MAGALEYEMLDIRWIRDNPDGFDAAIKTRGMEPMADLVKSIYQEFNERNGTDVPLPEK